MAENGLRSGQITLSESEKPTGETPVAEQKNGLTVEKKEQSEQEAKPETPAEALDRLNTEKLDLERKGSENFAIGNFSREGGQFLIRQFSAEAFANAVATVYNSPDKKPSMYAVIQQLVPDASHRMPLYDQMDQFADQAAGEFRQQEAQVSQGGDQAAITNFDQKYGHSYGPNDNVTRGQHFNIDDYRTLDRLGKFGLAGIAKTISRLKSTSLALTDMSPGVAHAGTLEPAKFAQELHEQKDSLSALYGENAAKMEQSRDRLRQEARALEDSLANELDTQSKALEANALTQLAEFNNQLNKHFEKATQENGQQLSEEQAAPILADLDKRYSDAESKCQESIEATLAPLKQQLERAQSLQR